jgi:hypothetical protein
MLTTIAEASPRLGAWIARRLGIPEMFRTVAQFNERQAARANPR